MTKIDHDIKLYTRDKVRGLKGLKAIGSRGRRTIIHGLALLTFSIKPSTYE